MKGLLLATVVATGAAGVPDEVVERSHAVVAWVLEGVSGEVSLRIFRTKEEMEAAVREVDPRVGADFAAYYHYRTRTIFAYMAPRPDAALYQGRLPGLMVGALAHEAMHAKGALTDPKYRSRTPLEIEGQADRAVTRLLPDLVDEEPGALAWEFLYESRALRLRQRGGFTDRAKELGWDAADPSSLPPAARAAWYTYAWGAAWGWEDRWGNSFGYGGPGGWILYEGSAEPDSRMRAFRLVGEPRAAARGVRFAKAEPLTVDVTPLDVGRGQIDLLFAFESRADYAKVAFLRRGGVRAMWKRDGTWRKDPLAPAPPLPPGRTARLSLHDGVVSVNGAPVLYLQQPEGRVGIGVWDGAADFDAPAAISAGR